MVLFTIGQLEQPEADRLANIDGGSSVYLWTTLKELLEAHRAYLLLSGGCLLGAAAGYLVFSRTKSHYETENRPRAIKRKKKALEKDQISRSFPILPARRRSVKAQGSMAVASSMSGQGINGLLNIGGNCCYVNAVFQALSVSSFLMEDLLSPSPSIVLQELYSFFVRLTQPSFNDTDMASRMLSPVRILKVLFNASANRWSRDQQDAHEFMLALLGFIAATNNRNRPKPSLLHCHVTETFKLDPWHVIFVNENICMSCGKKPSGMALTASSILTLPISHPCRLADLLEPSIHGREIISDWKCDACGPANLQSSTVAPEAVGCIRITAARKRAPKAGLVTKTGLLKISRIVKYPKLFIIHINRLSYASGYLTKTDCMLDFPMSLDAAYIPQLLARQYTLIAIIEHLGSAHSGHYITFRRAAGGPEAWARISDSEITFVLWHWIQQHCAAYILLYELVSS